MKPVVTTSEATEQLGISESTLIRAVNNGLVQPAFRTPRRHLPSVPSLIRESGWSSGHSVSALANFNLLLAEIDTEYAAILTADDWWEPTFLERMVPHLEAVDDSVLRSSRPACSGFVATARGSLTRTLVIHALWERFTKQAVATAEAQQFSPSPSEP